MGDVACTLAVQAVALRVCMAGLTVQSYALRASDLAGDQHPCLPQVLTQTQWSLIAKYQKQAPRTCSHGPALLLVLHQSLGV